MAEVLAHKPEYMVINVIKRGGRAKTADTAVVFAIIKCWAAERPV
jgi:hypothetical protein